MRGYLKCKLYFAKYKGWDHEAADSSMKCSARHALLCRSLLAFTYANTSLLYGDAHGRGHSHMASPVDRREWTCDLLSVWNLCLLCMLSQPQLGILLKTSKRARRSPSRQCHVDQKCIAAALRVGRNSWRRKLAVCAHVHRHVHRYMC